jgi:hypothetical protein
MRKAIKLVREGRYFAEVEVEQIEDAGGWSPYLSVDQARKLDDVRVRLRNGDVAGAAKLARVFELSPVQA